MKKLKLYSTAFITTYISTAVTFASIAFTNQESKPEIRIIAFSLATITLILARQTVKECKKRAASKKAPCKA